MKKALFPPAISLAVTPCALANNTLLKTLDDNIAPVKTVLALGSLQLQVVPATGEDVAAFDAEDDDNFFDIDLDGISVRSPGEDNAFGLQAGMASRGEGPW